jgi:NADPH-dependent 2,4-dienoyl-CoA reductase/sulfur reductase-like enzyme
MLTGQSIAIVGAGLIGCEVASAARDLGLATAGTGLTCDATGQVQSQVDGVFAVGDIAGWPDPATGGHHRREHWTSARTQAAAVAARICGQPPAPPRPDYAWTHQFGLLIQILGRPELADTTVQLEEKVLGYYAQDHIVGALILGAPRRKAHYNRLITAAGQHGQ